MTNLCGGGTSSPKPPLTNPYVIFTADKLVNLVATGGFTWLEDWVPGAGQLTFHLPEFCATDPPPMPSIDAARVASWAISPTGAANLRADMNAIVSNILWPTVCQCDSAPQPLPPTPTPQPPGVTVNPPQVLTPTGSPCGSERTLGTQAVFDASGGFVFDSQTWLQFPPTTQWCSFSVNVSGAGAAATYPYDWEFDWKATQGGPVIEALNYHQDHQDAVFRTTKTNAIVPPGATYPVVKVHSAAAAGQTFTVSAAFTPYCTAPGPDLTTPCCPPDPVTQQLLFQIYATVSDIMSQLEGVKGPYIDTVHHTGLSGGGTLGLQPKTVAVRVDITSDLSGWPKNPQTPDYYFSLGFLTPYAVGTPLKGARIVYHGQTFPWPSYTDQVGYQLSPSIVATITELQVAATA